LFSVWVWWGLKIASAKQTNETSQVERLITDSTLELRGTIRDEVNSLYSRLRNEDGYAGGAAKLASEKTFEIIRDHRANVLIQNGLEEKGCVAFLFTPPPITNGGRKFFLFDLVGNILKNRISLYVTENNCLVARFLMYDGRREELSVDLRVLEPGKAHPIFVQWHTGANRIMLVVGYEEYTRVIPNLRFDKLGPVLFMGTDFEGKFQAILGKGDEKLSDILKTLGYREYQSQPRPNNTNQNSSHDRIE